MKTFFLAFIFFFLAGGLFCHAQEEFWVKWSSDSPQRSYEWAAFLSSQERESYLDSMLYTLQKEGYLSPLLERFEVSADSLRVDAVLGEQYFWESVAIGNVPGEFLHKIEPVTSPYASASRWMQDVISRAENSGYPFAQVKLDSIRRNGNKLTAVADFDPGPLILWDSIQVRGETKTQAGFIQNLTGIRPGMPFSQKQLDEAGRSLSRTPYFKQLQSPYVDFKLRKAQPTFILIDRNTNVLDGVIGLLPNENEPGKMLITGQLDVELYHLGGKGRDVALHWQRLNVGTQSLEITAKESYLFNSPLDLQVGFNLLKQDSTFLTRYFSAEFGYHVGQNSYLRFFTRRQASDILNTESFGDITELPDIADYRWNLYGLGGTWNSLDSPYFPRRGLRLNGEFAIGNKKILENTGFSPEVYENLEMNSPQYVVKGEIEQHVFIKTGWGMWWRGSGGFIQNQNLLMNDLFRLGGLKSIRGFNENFFFARTYAYLNLEQRLFFGENSFLLVFADLGILENPYFAPSIDKPVSFGSGINLDTGSGIFRFIYGVGKSNVQPLQFSYSRIHFGYLARF